MVGEFRGERGRVVSEWRGDQNDGGGGVKRGCWKIVREWGIH